MNKIILTIVLVFGMVVFTKAQSFNNTNINDIKLKFIELEIITEKGIVDEYHIDFGISDKSDFFNTKIKNKDGTDLSFKTSMRLVNYITSIGFKLIETNISALGTKSRRIYLFKNNNI